MSSFFSKNTPKPRPSFERRSSSIPKKFWRSMALRYRKAIERQNFFGIELDRLSKLGLGFGVFLLKKEDIAVVYTGAGELRVHFNGFFYPYKRLIQLVKAAVAAGDGGDRFGVVRGQFKQLFI